MPLDPSNPSEQQTRPYIQIENERLPYAVIIKIEPNSHFTQEQINKIQKLSEEESFLYHQETQSFYMSKFVIFALGEKSSELSLHLCIVNPILWEHTSMWNCINAGFKEPKLKDAGSYYIGKESEEHFLGERSQGLSEKLPYEKVNAFRDEITNLNIGISKLY